VLLNLTLVNLTFLYAIVALMGVGHSWGIGQVDQ